MRKIRILIFFLLIFFILSPTVKAANEFFDAGSEALKTEELFDILDDDTLKMLSELGIDKLDFDTLFNMSPKKVVNLFLDILRGQTDSPIKSFLLIIAILIVLSVIESFFPDTHKTKLAIGTVAVLLTLTVIAKPIFTTVSVGMAAIEMTSKFMLLFIPRFVAVIAMNGNPTTALTFNSFMLAMAQGVVQTANYFIKPCTGIFFALGLTTAIAPEFKLQELSNQIKKTATVVLSFISMMFFSMLSLKGILSSASDNIASKGIKFLLSSFIPVVGSALSEGYSSLIGSIGLLKGALGTFAIISVTLINFPVIIKLAIWTLVLRFASALSTMISSQEISDMLKTIADATVLINVVLILNCVIIIISTGILLLIKAGT